MDPTDINQTKFCNKITDNIISNDLKKYILNDMKLRTGVEINKKYACIYNSNFGNNLKNPHLICLKTHGSPYLLYCTRIDKKIKTGYEYPKMFLVKYRFNNILFNGTLFETELVRTNQNKWFLLISDIYYYDNSKYIETITNRINLIHSILTEQYIDDEFSDICPIQVKRYFSSNDKDYIFNEFIPNLNYKIRGIYIIPFNPNYKNVLYFFTDSDLQNTKSVKNIYNFKVIRSNKPEIYDLYLNSQNNITKVDIAYIPNIERSKMINQLLTDKDNITMKCKYNTIFNKWEPFEQTIDIIDNINDIKDIKVTN